MTAALADAGRTPVSRPVRRRPLPREPAQRDQKIEFRANEGILGERARRLRIAGLALGVDDLEIGEGADLEGLGRDFQDLDRLLGRLARVRPRTVEQLGAHRCDLMLSGHTHGGQVNLPGLGRIALGASMRHLAAGLYAYRNTFIYVNKGVGFGLRFRFGVRPEVAVFTLRPGERGRRS